MSHTVCIVGAGSWGTAAAGLVAPHVDNVTLWAHSPQVAEAICATHHNPCYLT
ncbi:MAG: NAD(P)-dependent glycerol-3-phosphate dehydrogenase, partial [Atopobium minutum]|nr:NAD(P)-dependent glycerol-3-phosphate dehydrogenase [Atopobium minutum]